MTKKHYENAIDVKLADIFPIEYFRLASTEFKDIPCGFSEIPVFVNIKYIFAVKLSFNTPWDGELYGYVRNKKELYHKIGTDKITKITMSDWDDKFVMIFEDAEGNEEPVYYIARDEVKELLEKCQKPQKL